MIDENTLIDDDELNIKRADTAARVRRYRARKELEEEGLTVKKFLALKAARAAALSATVAAANIALQCLTPEQRVIFESEVFREGLPDGSSAGLRYLQAQMFYSVVCVKNDDFDAVRVDWVAEFYQDFVDTFPWAKELVYPRSIQPVAEGEPREYPVAEFHSAVAKWSALRDRDPSLTLADEPAEPTKRKRGRPKGKTKPATQTKPAVDPTVVASWSKPPAQLQKEHWNGIAADRAVREIARDVEEALPSKPVLFPRQNEL